MHVCRYRLPSWNRSYRWGIERHVIIFVVLGDRVCVLVVVAVVVVVVVVRLLLLLLLLLLERSMAMYLRIHVEK